MTARRVTSFKGPPEAEEADGSWAAVESSSVMARGFYALGGPDTQSLVVLRQDLKQLTGRAVQYVQHV